MNDLAREVTTDIAAYMHGLGAAAQAAARLLARAGTAEKNAAQIGRASCRERV